MQTEYVLVVDGSLCFQYYQFQDTTCVDLLLIDADCHRLSLSHIDYCTLLHIQLIIVFVVFTGESWSWWLGNRIFSCCEHDQYWQSLRSPVCPDLC